MIGKITKKDVDSIWFIEQGQTEEKELCLEEWVKPEFAKLGEAEVTVKNDKVSFIAMINDLAEKDSKEKPKESTGEFRENEVVEIKGKKHVIYEGLLRVAHEKGLKNFEIIEKFISADMKTAWVQVRAHVRVGDKSVETFFDGIGSSTPENTGTMTQDHPVEMAHTRAKGRALRDFLNIGQAMAEEIKQ